MGGAGSHMLKVSLVPKRSRGRRKSLSERTRLVVGKLAAGA